MKHISNVSKLELPRQALFGNGDQTKQEFLDDLVCSLPVLEDKDKCDA